MSREKASDEVKFAVDLITLLESHLISFLIVLCELEIGRGD